jgi:hypothetical protein
VYLWKACSDILPTRVRLHSCGLPLKESCLLCGVNAESTLHLGRDCSFSRTVLNASPLRTLLPQAIFNFKEWMLSCSQALSITQFDLMMMLFWSIWKARNDKVRGCSSPGFPLHLS